MTNDEMSDTRVCCSASFVIPFSTFVIPSTFDVRHSSFVFARSSYVMQHEQFQLHADIEDRHWWFVGRRRILCRLAAEVVPPSPDVTVIDVGCGTGGNIAAMADRYQCVGIDTSEEAIELARQRFPRVRFIAGHAPHDLGELAGRAQLFMLTDVLEHVADDYAMLSELLAAASAGSHFLLTVPADESLWSEHDESFGHYRRYFRGAIGRRLGRSARDDALDFALQLTAVAGGAIGPGVEPPARPRGGPGGNRFLVAQPAGQRDSDRDFCRRRPATGRGRPRPEAWLPQRRQSRGLAAPRGRTDRDPSEAGRPAPDHRHRD